MNRNNNNRLKQSGFTLVETIIYVALIGMVVSTFVSFGLKVTEIRNKNYVVGEVQANARNVMDFLAENIKYSSLVASPLSGETGNSIELHSVGGEIFYMEVIAGSLTAVLNAASPQFINSKETEITNLEFINLGSEGERDAIKIKLTIEYRGAESNDFKYSEELETTVSLRI